MLKLKFGEGEKEEKQRSEPATNKLLEVEHAAEDALHGAFHLHVKAEAKENAKHIINL